jgi:ferredoxin
MTTIAPQTTLTAVHEEDVLEFLVALGLDELYHSGRLRCSVCDARVIDAGLGAVRSTNEGAVTCCSSIECIRAFQTR